MNKRNIFYFCFVGAFLCVHPVVFAQGGGEASTAFKVKFSIDNGHIGKAFFGCAKKATEGYDKKLDIMAPPPGRATGYTAFVHPGKGIFLYKDIKPLAPKQSWKFLAKVFKNKPVVLSWKDKNLPEKYRFTILLDDEKYSMRERTKLRIKESGRLAIKASIRKNKEDSEKKEKSKQKEQDDD